MADSFKRWDIFVYGYFMESVFAVSYEEACSYARHFVFQYPDVRLSDDQK